MSSDALRQAVHEARDEAAPFAVLATVALVVLSMVSLRANWQLVGGAGWWVWLIAAAPYAALALMLLAGLDRGWDRERRRAVVKLLLVVVVVCSVLETGLLAASLLSSSKLGISGPQLLQSASTLWLSNVIAFGLAFWELDCGGPVRRALSAHRRTPDIQFPQDENPTLARAGWVPHLSDYLYLSTTNSIAFSPTDAMPLTRPAKALMALESAVSVVAVLLIAARAVNILHV
jgi:nitrate reductase NapE component